jgi:3'-phosphoadenosine 5'-phosphosulfate sulfotransferase (PAPS reductase)/FAD synthetase
MHIIFGNYGNQTVALMQWAYEQGLEDVYVINVATGWEQQHWHERVAKAQLCCQNLGFKPLQLSAKPGFKELIRDRGRFPSTKFQWCAGFLKGLPLLDWLDEEDPELEATVMLGKRRADSRANFNLPEVMESSEHYGDRRVWYPLYNTANDEFNRLIEASGLAYLPHRSLECDPCVNSFGNDLARLEAGDVTKVERLEQEVGATMFTEAITEAVARARQGKNTENAQQIEMFDMGCGSPYSCGE